MSSESTFQKATQSSKWFMLGTILQKIISLGTFFILARILLPEDYGVVAIVFIVVNFLDRFSTPGFGTALIQKKENIEKYIDIVWTFDLVKSFFIVAFILLAGDYIGAFFHMEESNRMLLQVSSALVVIAALANPRQLYFFKELDFKLVFYRDFAGQIAYAVFALSWALGVSTTAWALLVGHFARYIITTIMTYILYPKKPSLNFKFGRLKSLFGYSKWIYGQNTLDYLLNSLDNIFVGRLMNNSQLGFYSRARDLPSTVLAPFLSLANKVGFPAYARVQDKMDKVKDGFVKSVDLLLFVGIPFSLLLIFEGGSIVHIFLGQKWLPIVVPLKIISFGYIFLGLVSLIKPLFNAIGRPDISFKSNLIQLVISLPIFYFAIQKWNLMGAAFAVVTVWFVVLLYNILQARPILRLGKDKFIPSLITISFASFGTFLVAFFIRDFIHGYFGNVIILCWVAFLGFIYLTIFIIISKLWKRGPWQTVVLVIKELRKNPVKKDL